MGVYTRTGSPYWWMRVQGRRASTKILVDAPTAVQRRDNKRLAEQVYHTRMAARAREQHDLPGPRQPITFAMFSRWYLVNVSTHKRGHEREREILSQLSASFGSTPLSHVSNVAVQEWITARRRRVAASTVNRELDVLKHVLAMAVPTYLAASPIAGLRRLRTEKLEVRLLSHVEEARLLATLQPADRAIVVLGLDTLMRLSDIVNLKRVQDHRASITVLDPKGNETYRVPVSKRLRAALAQVPHTGPYYFSHRRKADNPSNYRNSVKSMLRRACARSHIPYGRANGGITFHALRHTGTSRMLEAGHSPRTVQAIGGWRSLQQLARYGHPSERATRAAVESVGQTRTKHRT